MKRVKEHNEYFRTVRMQGRKSCPHCYTRLEQNESIWSWGEYHHGKWYTVMYFCKACFHTDVQAKLHAHSALCRCQFNLIGYGCSQLPLWLTLGE